MEKKGPDKKDSLNPTSGHAHFFVQATSGPLRWLATILTIAGFIFLIWTFFDRGEHEVFFPFHLKGRELYWTMGIATAFWLLMAIVNWKNWKRKSR
jgi:hypothetical protein